MKNKIKWVLQIITVFAFYFPLKSMAQESKADVAIQQIMQENPVMGFSVAVVKNNKMIYNKSFGFKDAETKTPLESLRSQNLFLQQLLCN
jgi:hypothetical protein